MVSLPHISVPVPPAALALLNPLPRHNLLTLRRAGLKVWDNFLRLLRSCWKPLSSSGDAWCMPLMGWLPLNCCCHTLVLVTSKRSHSNSCTAWKDNRQSQTHNLSSSGGISTNYFAMVFIWLTMFAQIWLFKLYSKTPSDHFNVVIFSITLVPQAYVTELGTH